MIASLSVQLLNGLAGASTLFLIAVGLSLIFGVTRIVNFAHGSMTMIGLYVAWSLTEVLGRGPLGRPPTSRGCGWSARTKRRENVRRWSASAAISPPPPAPAASIRWSAVTPRSAA